MSSTEQEDISNNKIQQAKQFGLLTVVIEMFQGNLQFDVGGEGVEGYSVNKGREEQIGNSVADGSGKWKFTESGNQEEK